MPERVTPRTVWSVLREAWTPAVLSKAARLGGLVSLIVGGAYLVILGVLFDGSGTLVFQKAALGLLLWAAMMLVLWAAFYGILRFADWNRRRR